MCDVGRSDLGLVEDSGLTRRRIGALAGAGVAASVVDAAQAEGPVLIEREVEIRTADGQADAVVIYPEGAGARPGVLMVPPGPDQQIKRQAGRVTLTPDAVALDGAAYVAWLDALPRTSQAKVGVQGYCMGAQPPRRRRGSARRRLLPWWRRARLRGAGQPAQPDCRHRGSLPRRHRT